MSDCSDCRYFKPHGLRDGRVMSGECHRHSPLPVSTNAVCTGADWSWPIVVPRDWCGDHEVARGTERLHVALSRLATFEAAVRQDRCEDGGQPGHLEVCQTCSGTGVLHVPDEVPAAVAP